MTEKMVGSINTPAGQIEVGIWESDEYPGVTVYINGQQVVIVECAIEDEPDTIHVAVWEDDNRDPEYNGYFKF